MAKPVLRKPKKKANPLKSAKIENIDYKDTATLRKFISDRGKIRSLRRPSMKLILTHDVDGLGSAGEVVEVKDGYGRNYLIPRGYATKWTKGGQKQVDQIAEARRKRAIASLEEANALRDALQSEALTIVKTAGESGRLFGAVTNAEIAAAATEATGKTVDRRTINVTTPIKSLGSYKATAKLHDDIVASLTIEVVEVVTKKKKKKK